MNKKSIVLIGVKAKEAILRGVNLVYDAVRLTLGPEGRNVLMYGLYGRNYRLTNDGATVAGVIEPKDEFEALGAAVVKDAAERTNQKAGDATTTTAIILGKIVNDAFKISGEASSIGIGSALSPIRLSRELLSASKIVVEKIKKSAQKVESLDDLKKIAYVAMENRELGDVVADWYMGAGAVIIACEKSGRIGHGMDIAPAYLAATLERLSARGLSPRRELSDGEAIPATALQAVDA